MKTIMTAIAATLFTAGVGATDIYGGFAEGNSDLYGQPLSADDFTGVQPSVGDSRPYHQGFGEGNTDLFQADAASPMDSGEDPDIYMGFSGSTDLSY